MFMRGERHPHTSMCLLEYPARGSGLPFFLGYRHVPRVPEESPEQVQKRVRKMCEEQEEAEERRKRESAARKENAEREREQGIPILPQSFTTY